MDFDSPTGDHLRRGRKIYRESLPKQKKLNEKRAKRYFEALIEANFKGGRDLVLHLTFSQECYPESEADAKKRVQSFLRNINGKRKRRGLGNAKYIIVFETSKRGRFHFHILMDGELDRDTVEATWRYGYCNADRLKADPKDGLSAIINYLSKGGNNPKTKDGERSKWDKRWIPSKGLIRPWISESQKSISRRKFNSIVELPEDSEVLIATIENDNKGYFVQSIEKSFNEQTGRWYIFCRLRLKKSTEKDREHIHKKSTVSG